MTSLREFYLNFEGTKIRCWDGGSGRSVILLHGSGAGSGTFSNFGAVLDGLCASFHVLATDLVGYGLSGRRPSTPYFDVEMWVRQLQAVIDYCGEEQVRIVGHSLAGALALKAAARDRRIAAVLATGTMGTPMPPRPEGWGWAFPPDRAAILRHIEGSLYDKSLVPEAEIERRAAVLFAPGYQEYFTSMFGGDRRKFFDESTLAAEELAQIRCPVLFMHGQDDTFLSPEESSLSLAKSIPQSDVAVLGRCGHGVALEHPAKFLTAARSLFGNCSE
jgi:2-hydroxymuconate-semialdehyde hydrolase